MSLIKFNVYDDINRIDEPVKSFKVEFKSKYWDVGYWDQQGFMDPENEWIPSDGDVSLNFEVILKKKYDDTIFVTIHSTDNELWSAMSGTNDAMICSFKLIQLNENSFKLKLGKIVVNENDYSHNDIAKRKEDLTLTEKAINQAIEKLMNEFNMWAQAEFKVKYLKIR